MFTGIVRGMGEVAAIELTPKGGRLRVRAAEMMENLWVAGSVAVNGCCLTMVELAGEEFIADLSGETLRRTSFGKMRVGMRVNLEQPLKVGEEMGGHFVQGHVDGVGRVVRLEAEGENWWLGVRMPEDLRRYVAMKGSIALDGISLTVAGWKDGVAECAVIPFTFENTNVKGMRVGDAVNVECDVLAKYVEAQMKGGRVRAKKKI